MYKEANSMKHFTKEQISNISQVLYDYISDKNGDNPMFRDAGISLIASGLQSVVFKTNKAEQISKSEAKKLMNRLLLSIKEYNCRSGHIISAEDSYSRLPIKTRSLLYNYVMRSLTGTVNADLLANIVCEHINNNVTKESDKEKHIGEVRIMNCGQVCTVIGWYRGKVTLRFEDGTILEDKRYDDYKKGSIMNPKLMDLTGYKFNNFEVLGLTGSSDKHRNKLWYCKCSCGKIVELSRPQILGRCACPKNCGCKS